MDAACDCVGDALTASAPKLHAAKGHADSTRTFKFGTDLLRALVDDEITHSLNNAGLDSRLEPTGPHCCPACSTPCQTISGKAPTPQHSGRHR